MAHIRPFAFVCALLFGGVFIVRAHPLLAANNTLIHAVTKTSVCGNGIKEGGEHCDGGALGGMTCSNLGFSGGNLGCSPSCEFNTSSCTTTAQSTAIPLFFADIGGEYTLSDADNRSATIILPPDFYSTDVRLQEFLYDHADVAPTAPPPSGKQFVSNVYDFVFIHPDGEVISEVSKPVTLTLEYADADVAGLDEASIAPYRKESGESSWAAINGATVDTAHNTVSFTTDHFSSFTLIAPPAASVTSSNAATSTVGGGGALGEPIGTPIPDVHITIPAFPIERIVPYVNTLIKTAIRRKQKAVAPKPVQIAPRATTSPKPIKYIAPIPAPKARRNFVDTPCRFSCRFAAIYYTTVDIFKNFHYFFWK